MHLDASTCRVGQGHKSTPGYREDRNENFEGECMPCCVTVKAGLEVLRLVSTAMDRRTACLQDTSCRRQHGMRQVKRAATLESGHDLANLRQRFM